MQAPILSIPGYKINEYLLVMRPHEELANKLLEIRKNFADTYDSANARWGQPQVVLASFMQYEMMEEKIRTRLKTIAMGQYPFKIELKDYGSFPSHSIYVNVTTKLPLQELVKEIRTDTQRLMKFDQEHKPHFILEPHLIIARKLKPWQYEKGWLEYSHKTFTGRFIAEEMLLLKRPVGEIKYQRAGRFSFQNLPVHTRQGELFG